MTDNFKNFHTSLHREPRMIKVKKKKKKERAENANLRQE
jgi:hypothetical protein